MHHRCITMKVLDDFLKTLQQQNTQCKSAKSAKSQQ